MRRVDMCVVCGGTMPDTTRVNKSRTSCVDKMEKHRLSVLDDRLVPIDKVEGARGDAAACVADGAEPPAAAVGARVHGVDDGVHRG